MPISDEQKKMNINEAQEYLHIVSKFNPKIPSVIPGGTYNAETKEAVKAFQNEYGLPPTGEIDNATWEALYNAYKEALKYFAELERIRPLPFEGIPIRPGSAGYAVYIIQAMLNTIAQFYDNMEGAPINGIFDKATSDSVKFVQKVNGQEPTGVIDESTWNNLAKLYNYHAAIDEGDKMPLQRESDEENAECRDCVG